MIESWLLKLKIYLEMTSPMFNEVGAGGKADKFYAVKRCACVKLLLVDLQSVSSI